jgi:hypothetical protein
MNIRRFGTRAALVLAALLVISPLFAQSQPPMPGYRPLLPVTPAQPNPPPPGKSAQVLPAPARTTPTKAGKTFTRPPQPEADRNGDGVADWRVEDKDGDGVQADSDCDDLDASRYPGATEVPNDKDEDCNDRTIGELDQDHDGYTSWRISNFASYGSNNSDSGRDCDDSQAGIRPDAQELPNRIDDNCDGYVDNLLGTWWTPGPK